MKLVNLVMFKSGQGAIIRSASLILLMAASAASALAAAPAPRVSPAPSGQACHARRNSTPAKLLECIQQAALWQHLVDFQTIADQNPDANGHGNRDAGTSGYKESVSYVANLMRQAVH